jgi:two-component system, OmpR family, sensor kinase
VTHPEVSEITEPHEVWMPPTPVVLSEVDKKSRRRFVPNSLTGRLVLGVVALVIVLVATIGSSTYLLLRAFLYERFDSQLTSTAEQNASSISRAFGGSAQLVSAGQRMWVVLLNTDGSVPRQTLNANPTQFVQLELSSEQVQSFIAHPGELHSIHDGSGQALKAESVPLRDGTILVVGLSTEEVERTLRRLLVLELAIGTAAVALAAGLTSWGVRAGFRPLRRVTRTAQEVTAELGPDGAGLDRRVPDADPTTEVGQVASSVNTLLGAVQTEFAARLRSEDRMRQFLADASHELRTPLTSIRGYAELSRLQGKSTNSADDPMRRIEVEGTRMSRLVEDLLVLARGDDRSTQTRIERVDIDSLLQDAAGSAQSAHPERAFTLVKSGGATVLGDRDQLRRLVLNLMNNAAVHTAAGPPIRLEGIRGSTDTGPAVVLRVIDTGPGLAPDEAAHVFERFWRADKARSRAKGGSGLGMAIVAQIAEAHRGTVTFDSSVEGGTSVAVTLPMLGDRVTRKPSEADPFDTGS